MRSKIEANEYKDFILGFIFYKYLSEKEVALMKSEGFSEEKMKLVNEDDTEYVEHVKNELGYFIAYNNLFSTWLSKGNDFDVSDVTDALNAFNNNIDSVYKKVYEKIFNTLQTGLTKLGDTNQARTKSIRSLLKLIEQEYGISTDRRTIYTEMEILDKFGLDIQQKKGKNPGYYIGARDFELPELKLLVDAVQSSKFITEKKSKELITKLEKLSCRTDAAMLSKYVFIVNRPKTENETVYCNVDYIHTAIYESKEIKFHYAEWPGCRENTEEICGAFYRKFR